MATTLTTNYNLIKPNPFEEVDLWGGELNTNFDIIDSTMKSISNVANAAVPSASPYIFTGLAGFMSRSPVYGIDLASGTAGLRVSQGLYDNGLGVDTAQSGVTVWSGNSAAAGTIRLGLQVAAATPATFEFYKSRGGTGAKSIILNNDALGRTSYFGFDGVSWLEAARIEIIGQTPILGKIEGKFSLLLQSVSGSLVERLSILPTGAVTMGSLTTTGSIAATAVGGITSNSPVNGIGYAPGAGGNYTQLTDKATAVPVTTLCGVITTAASNLVAGTTVNFQVTGGFWAAVDMVLVKLRSNNANIQVWAYFSSSGTFRIAMRNVGATDSAVALVIDYMVLNNATT